jgi:hypothetical protein
LLQVEGNEEPPAEEDSQPEPNYNTMDVTYGYRNPRVDAIRLRRRNPIPSILEGYQVTSNSAPSDSDTSEDNSDLEIEAQGEIIAFRSLAWAKL